MKDSSSSRLLSLVRILRTLVKPGTEEEHVEVVRVGRLAPSKWQARIW